MDPNALLEGRSRETTIARDSEGRWFHDGQALEHPNLTRAFDRWVSVAENGRYCLKNDINWAYITLEGAPYFVRAVRTHAASAGVAAEKPGAEVLLSNDAWQSLEPGSLRLGPDGVLYCDGPEGLAARFDRHAMSQLEGFLGEDQGGIYVELGSTRVRPVVANEPLLWRSEERGGP